MTTPDHTTARQHAHRLLEARATSAPIPPFSRQGQFGLQEAYEVSYHLNQIRMGEGENPLGRKLSLTNRKLWHKYAGEPAHTPIWNTLFDSTVRFLSEAQTWQSLDGAMQPRIAPELVFQLAHTPPDNASVADIAECLEWVAHGMEIDVSPYPGWEFSVADAVAAFGMHGTLLIAEPRVLSSSSRAHLADTLSTASVSLSCNEHLVAAGFGDQVCDSPVHAIWQLHQELQGQTRFPRLEAGEIVSTGSWTDPHPVQAGEVWSTAFSGISLAGLTINLV